MTSSSTIRVAVADDQELMRSALGMVIRSQPDLELVGEAVDGRQIVSLCRERRVDVVLMDVRMPHLDGIEATRQVLALPDGPKVIVVTTFDLDEYAFAAIRAGASGFLLKDARGEDIVDAIRVVHAGHAVVSPSTTRRLIEHLVASPAPDRGEAQRVLDGLTARERDVLLELATGASNAEIAKRLFLSESTVKTHVGHLLGKLQLRDRVQAVVLAYEIGLVRPGT
ncbi:response regulator transcription factor [Intrasporangium sp. DVR]|uniref:response regulator transcription factor n=1 Tax=Intrasporangium sp. DVR TaxID=3127867 RepID=UPI00313A5680